MVDLTESSKARTPETIELVFPPVARGPDGRLLERPPQDPVNFVKVKRIQTLELLDLASDQLVVEFEGTKATAVFARGFSPIKELMRLYGEEMNKKVPAFDRRLGLLKALLPYVYPTFKSIEFEASGALPVLKIVLSETDDEDVSGKSDDDTAGNG
jgi:hypothetical protein